MNLWLLTEERPKKAVLEQIFRTLSSDRNLSLQLNPLSFKPILSDRRFSFKYEVLGANIQTIDHIYIITVSGDSSFTDFLLFIQEEEPSAQSMPLYVIEETKTDDSESRNVGVYQRASKFVYVDFFYPDCEKIMLYNIQVANPNPPTNTNIFGTRMLLTLGVRIIGKNLDQQIFQPFRTIDELIEFKNRMRAAPRGNVPIIITQNTNNISFSARLIKSGQLAHDPNIGASTLIAKTIRELGWNQDVIITRHGLSQNHIRCSNKFVAIASRLSVRLDGLTMPVCQLPNQYWHYEREREKLATIFIHLILEELPGVSAIYENHAGCERGYFYLPNRTPQALPKRDSHDENLYIPDLIICDSNTRHIYIFEGKTYAARNDGIAELQNYDALVDEWITPYYPDYEVSRHVILYGSQNTRITDPEVVFLLNSNGEMITSQQTPDIITEAINQLSN